MGYLLQDGKIRVMVDIETTGIKPGCGVWNIGIVVLGHPDMSREWVINPTQIEPDRCNQDTLDWQAQHNLAHWLDTRTINLDSLTESQMLERFISHLMECISGYNVNDVEFWSQGNFDYPILAKACKYYGISYPWKYRQLHDLRTISSWYNMRTPKTKDSHGALVDAKNQAVHLYELLKIRAGVSG